MNMRINLLKWTAGIIMAGYCCLEVAQAGVSVSLFDGSTLEGWVRRGGEASFTVEDGCIVGRTQTGTGNSFLCTEKEYSDFILKYEYKADPKINSGVQIRSYISPRERVYYWNGVTKTVPANRVHGYQIEIDASNSTWVTGEIYDEERRGWLNQPDNNAEAREAYQMEGWNQVCVEARGGRLRTWLNGVPVADVEDGLDLCGFIGLQVHAVGSEEESGREIRWRNLQIEELDPQGYEPLFNGKDLNGWIQRGGKAPFEAKEGAVVGRTMYRSGGNSFLCTEKDYSDFVLEYEYLVDSRMNSGVQIRSHCFPREHIYRQGEKTWKTPPGRVHGYQIEIEPSSRAWSAGIYDEGRRGWIYDLKKAPESARKAFRQNEWNKVRVEARGSHLRTWLNGIPVADLDDEMDRSGFIALQVHGIGKESEEGREIRWRNLRIMDLTPEKAGVPPSPAVGKEIASSGAWTWFNDPRAVVRNGFLYAGYVREDGAVCVTVYNMESGECTESVLSSWRERDDHDNVGFIELQDGRLGAFYSTHGSKHQMFLRFAKVPLPQGQEDWGEEITVDWSEQRFRGGVCYNNPFQLANEPERIYNFIRGENWNPTLLISDDNGKSWNEPIHLIYHKDRPYAKYASNGRDRIDILYTDGHPRMVDNNVYHLVIQDGEIMDSTGQPLGVLENMDPLPSERGSLVYCFGQAYKEGRPWIWDISYNEAGIPQALHTVKAGENDIRYFYAVWKPEEKRWVSREIAHAGACLYRGEDDYVGGATFDPEHPERIYISSEFSPLNGARTPYREIYRGETTDGGENWSWISITHGSKADQLRPYVPRTHGKEQCLLWFTGRYTRYQDFDTSVRALVE